MITPLFLALVLASSAPQQLAPPQADNSSATVTVTGRRPDQAKAIRHMTAAIAPLGDAAQPLPRFAEPICPSIDGLPSALSTRFADRMRDQARAAGLAVEGVGCSPNITILFVPNGQEVARALRKQRPAVFGALEPHQIARLLADAAPVHVWSFTEVRSRDDDRLRIGTTIAGKDAPELQVRNASILQSPTRIVVDGSVMLIDQQASVGKTITQLADYATMRILAQARPVAAAAAEPTILRLFDGGVPTAPEMTAYDVAYLKALYHGEPTELPLTKIGIMARAINKSLSAAAVTPEK